jgi:hypothetical protein
MRYLIALPLALLAVPAQAAPQQIQIPRELTDPATVEKVTRMMDSLSNAFLDLPVGEIQAAAEGRAPTPQDRGRRIRDLGATTADIDRQIAEAKPAVEQSMKAFATALPSITKALSEAADAMERATANMPQPGYPRR